jgi:REP element-mobilizing transposase RayT
MSRADGKGKIFETDVDRQDFVKRLAEACAKTGFEVHAYCLMRNHFHLVVETPNGNLVAGMRWLLGAYALRFNPRHHAKSHPPPKTHPNFQPAWHRTPAPAARHRCRTPNQNKIFSPVGPASSGKRHPQ